MELDTYNVQDDFRHLTDLLGGLPSETGSGSKEEVQWKWAAVIRIYSKRSLTMLSDKLLALEGLARAFDERKTLGTYVAGLWWNEFHRHLLCRCDQSEGVMKRSPVYR